MNSGLKIVVQNEDTLLETISLLFRNGFTNIEIEKSDDKYYIICLNKVYIEAKMRRN